MVMEIAKITNNFEIRQNLSGEFEIPNLQMYKDTFQAYADNIDEVLVVTTDESSVDGAKATKKEFKNMKEAIDLKFADFEKQIEEVKNARLDLKRIMTRAEESIDKKIKNVYKKWIEEAISEYERLASFDVTFDMLDAKAFTRKQTKKSIFETVEKEILRLEDEFKKREEERETIEKYCKKAGQPVEPYTILIGQRDLNDILKLIDVAEEREAKRVQEEEERRKAQEALQNQMKEARSEIENEIVPTLETAEPANWTTNTDEVLRLWTIRLWLSDEQKAKLKQFLKENDIMINSVTR